MINGQPKPILFGHFVQTIVPCYIVHCINTEGAKQFSNSGCGHECNDGATWPT